MEYRLEIYAFDNCQDDCIKVFTSTDPFPSLQVGNFLDASTWERTRSKRLRVLSVEHAIVEKSPLGIDPSGSIVNRTLIHTEGVSGSVGHRGRIAH
jgi:hypothetical protein